MKNAEPSGSELVAKDFDRAREYAAEFESSGRRAVANAILCGAELCRLHALHEITHGGDRRSDAYKSKTQVASLISWPQIVEREMGFSHDTAGRWMALARKVLLPLGWEDGGEVSGDLKRDILSNERVCEIAKGQAKDRLLLADAFGAVKWTGKDEEKLALIRQIAAGKPVSWMKGGDEYFRGGTRAETETASALLEKIAAGVVSPSRAWAGLAGASATKKKPRSANRLAKEINMALGRLNSALVHWDSLEDNEQILLRARIEETVLKLYEDPGEDLFERAKRAIADLRVVYRNMSHFSAEQRKALIYDGGALTILLPKLEDAQRIRTERIATGKRVKI